MYRPVNSLKISEQAYFYLENKAKSKKKQGVSNVNNISSSKNN